jgi:HK97 family phage portal protein
MGVIDRARTIARQWSPPSWWPIPGPYTSVFVSDTGAQWWQMPVTARTALSVAAVYRALAIYADEIGTLPVQRLRGDYEQLPEPPFVARPAGDVVGWTDEVGQILWSLVLRGNAYLLVTGYDWTGYPESFYVLNPDTVTVEPAPAGGWQYRWTTGSGGEMVLANPSPLELLHVRWQRPPGAPVGLGILDVNAGPGSALAAAYAAQSYATDSLSNPVPPAVLTHPLRLNKDQAAALQTQWATSTGRGRSVPAVLSGGVTYQPLTVTPRDVQLIESQRWSATSIAVMFGLPPYMLGGSTGDSLTYSTVEGEMTRLWVQTLQPMCIRLQRAFNAWLPSGQRLRFNPDALLRSQTLDRFNAHKIAIDAGFETVDEVRQLENRPPLESTAEVPAALPAARPTDAPTPAPAVLEVVP